MSNLSRRDFLKAAALSVGAVSLGSILEACGKHPPGTPTANHTSTSAPVQETATSPAPTNTLPKATETPSTPTATATNTPLIPPDLVAVRGGEPEELVRKAMAVLGGMEKFVPKGANVVIKPNICVAFRTYEYAATTNPWVMGALVKLCLEAGAASIKVMDKPFNGTQEQAYKMSGIQEQVEAAGGEMVNMLTYKYVELDIPDAKILKKTAVYDDILKADVLINVPIAKQHSSSARLTIGMKNLMGVVWDRAALHADLGQCIAELNSLIRPQLNVIDAVRIMTANGPSGGSLSYVKKLDTVIASADIVAADSFTATLFEMKPEDLAYIVSATSMGLGRSDLENMRIEQISLRT